MTLLAHVSNRKRSSGGKGRGFTLVEIVISCALSAMMLSGIVYGYIMSAKRAEWSSYSLAANALAIMKMEQTRSAKWDTQAYPPVDELVATNFPMSREILDIPIRATNIVFSNGIPIAGNGVVYATNMTTITTISTNPALKMIRVDCSWMFINKGPFTNTVVTYRTTDQ